MHARFEKRFVSKGASSAAQFHSTARAEQNGRTADAALGGGLTSYGFEGLEQFQAAATYVDRILRGTKPAELPLQLPTRYQLVINLKAAKAIGLSVPESLLARADEVIESFRAHTCCTCSQPLMCRFSDACMTTYPRAPTAGVGKAPRHEVAGGGAPSVQRALRGCAPTGTELAK